jgi:hypothetical protein
VLCTREFVGLVFKDAHMSRGLRACVYMNESAGVVSICVVLCNSKKKMRMSIHHFHSKLKRDNHS